MTRTIIRAVEKEANTNPKGRHILLVKNMNLLHDKQLSRHIKVDLFHLLLLSFDILYPSTKSV
jgi:hypothetical protein